ncbi:unnamed protein product [Protopolystoma xenopodis]|uniref:Uncharacterized protein n=1 Tax=Protopolystoma xenopodis TaxID=117903 RepID=A0A3S5AXM6_9PLAT|nr:unnamed protein product [Protopolystoma xenopodis]
MRSLEAWQPKSSFSAIFVLMPVYAVGRAQYLCVTPGQSTSDEASHARGHLKARRALTLFSSAFSLRIQVVKCTLVSIPSGRLQAPLSTHPVSVHCPACPLASGPTIVFRTSLGLWLTLWPPPLPLHPTPPHPILAMRGANLAAYVASNKREDVQSRGCLSTDSELTRVRGRVRRKARLVGMKFLRRRYSAASHQDSRTDGLEPWHTHCQALVQAACS